MDRVNEPDSNTDAVIRGSPVQKDSHANIKRPDHEREQGNLPPPDPRTADRDKIEITAKLRQ